MNEEDCPFKIGDLIRTKGLHVGNLLLVLDIAWIPVQKPKSRLKYLAVIPAKRVPHLLLLSQRTGKKFWSNVYSFELVEKKDKYHRILPLKGDEHDE